MRPYEARDSYREAVAAEPRRADLRVRYANTLRRLEFGEEARAQYRAAIDIEPANLEARLNLGRLAVQAGDRASARRLFESVVAEAPNSGLSRREREDYVSEAEGEIDELAIAREALLDASTSGRRQPPIRVGSGRLAPGRLALDRPKSAASAISKVGRNDPCPCGSGRKYKKCHGR